MSLHWLGDSIVHGYSNTLGPRGPLRALLRQRGFDITERGTRYNTGSAADGIAHDGIDGWPTANFWANWSQPVDVAIIALGANDIVTDAVPTATYISRLTGIRNYSAAVCKHVILVAPYAGDWTAPQLTLQAEYLAAIPALATGPTTVCTSIATGWNNGTMLRAADTTHPNDAVGSPFYAAQILAHGITNCGW